MDAVAAAFASPHLSPQLRLVKPSTPSALSLEWVHERAYLELAQREIEAGRPQLSTGDTEVGPTSWEIAQLAASAVSVAVDAVISGEAPSAFCAVRPPGHHANQHTGMGFCVLNNVALGVRYAQRKYGIGKVAVVDWDVHHGNGTQDIFYDDGTVFFFSTHQHPWYPGTGLADERGTGAGFGTTFNVPLAAYSGRKEIFQSFEGLLLPALAKFRPELIFISAGFDSRRGDPLGLFQLEDCDFRDLTRMMMQAAGESADGRLVSVLEGGYRLSGLTSAVTAHLEALAGIGSDEV